MCQLKRVEQYGASGSDTWECSRGKARQTPRSTNAEDRNRVTIFRTPTVPTEQLRRECNTREQGHRGNCFTDSPRLVTAR